MSNEVLSVEGQLVGVPLQEYTAGAGIVVDNVNHVIKSAYNETVLFDSGSTVGVSSATLSETVDNFEKIAILLGEGQSPQYQYIDTEHISDVTVLSFTAGGDNAYLVRVKCTISGTTITVTNSRATYGGWTSTSVDSVRVSSSGDLTCIIKVIGIGRK